MSEKNIDLVFAGWKGLVVIFIYGLLMLAIGFFVSFKNKKINENMNEYFLGGGTLGYLVLFFTFFATTYSGNTVIGFAPMAYRAGYSWIQVITVMIFVNGAMLLFAPRLYKLSKEFKFITPTDWINHRFNSKLITLTSAIIMMYAMANFILAQIVAIGHGVSGLTGDTIPYQVGVVYFVIIMLIYSWLGGMRSVAYIDFIQGIILFLGVGVLIMGTIFCFGDLQQAAEYVKSFAFEKIAVPENHSLVSWFCLILLWGIGASMYPQLIQRVYAAKNTSVLKNSLIKMSWAPFLITFPVFIVGIIGIKAFPGLGKIESEQLIGMLANVIASQNNFYFWSMILLFGAILAAIISTADSALLSFCSFISNDIYGRFINPKASEHRKVLAGKIVGLFVVALLLIIAWNPPGTLYEILVIKFELLVQVAPAMILSMYLPWLNKRAVWLGMVSGSFLSLVMTLLHIQSYLGVFNGLWGLALNILITIGGSLILQPKIKILAEA